MPKLRPWFSRWPAGRHPGTVAITKAGGATFAAGDLYYVNGSSEAVPVGTEGGSDIWADIFGGTFGDIWDEDDGIGGGTAPAAIGGLVYAPTCIEDPGKLLAIRASATTTFAFSGTRPPVSGDVGSEVDLAFDAGVLIVDPDSSSAPRMTVVDVDLVREIYFCKVMSAYIQE